jgi:hypothetical protein
MAEPLSYLHIRRQLIPKNPYFQQDLIEVRQKLGIPQAGFDAAVAELGKGIPRHPTGLWLGKPDLASLKEKARQLGLPLEGWLVEQETHCAQRGRNFELIIAPDGQGSPAHLGRCAARMVAGSRTKECRIGTLNL